LDDKQLSPKLKKISGSVKLPANFNEEQALRDCGGFRHKH